MSRWDALRSENKKKPRSRNRGRSSNNQSLICSSPEIMHARDFRGEHGANSLRTSFDERASLFRLESFLYSHEQGLRDEPLVVSGVIETLRSYERFLLTSKSRTADSASIVILCKLLRVEDTVLHQSLQRLIELVLEEGCKLQSNKEVAICIDEIRKKCFQYPSDSSIRQLLATIVASSGLALPAEDLAQSVVTPLLLPVLESTKSNRMLFTKTCKALSALIINQSHRSALLAPLLNDVSADGMEEFVPNPIRQRLSAALECHLIDRHERASWRELACCYLLADVVDSSIKIDRSLSPRFKTGICLSRTKDFFMHSLCAANQAIYVAAMFLLRSLIRYELRLRSGSVSQAMVDLLSRIIFDPEHSHTDSIGFRHSLAGHGFMYGHFLSLVHASWTGRSHDSELFKASFECLSEIVSALPWSRWMSSDKLMGGCASSESGFGRRTVNFLRGLVNVTHCAISSCDEESIAVTCCLVESYFGATKVEHHELSQFSMHLWSRVAETFLTHPSERVRHKLVSVLVESCGGQMLPDGKSTTIYEPAKRWLSSQCSENFLVSLFSTVDEFTSHPSHPSIILLCSILRSVPRIATSDSWKRCHSLFSSVGDVDVNMGCLVILDAVVRGRGQYDDDSSSVEPIRDVVWSTLSKSLNSADVKIRCLGLSLLGSLSTKDWEQLDLGNKKVNVLLDSGLNLCRDEIQSVRTAACKHIGQFCTHYVHATNCQNASNCSHIRSIVDMICNDMNLALLDEKPKVRSMAMFTVGNIADALRTNSGRSLKSNVLVDSCKMVEEAMKDSSEKVVINSIRAAGHWGYLLAREQTGDAPETLSCLVNELLNVLATAVETLSKGGASLTWKKRGVLMKYGCGVCHSLGCIFLGLVKARSVALRNSCSRAIHQLVTCIEKYRSLTEKITFSAMAALGKLSSNMLSQTCEGSGILGGAIATCLCLLNENHLMSTRTLNPKQERLVEVCLAHLLAVMSPLDASATLEKDSFSQDTLAFLYSWMIQNTQDRTTFATFASVLRRFEFKFTDVSLVQSFISRSLRFDKEVHAIQNCTNFDDCSEL